MTAAIRFDQVSKAYRLGEHQRALRHSLAGWGKAVFGRRTADDELFWALRDVSFELGEGEALGIIGPNGAGKTTTLKLLSKITQPTTGTIQVLGRVSALIELGAGFHPDLTGRENIYLNGAILGLTRAEIERRFDSIVAFSGLEQFIDTPVKRYSSGMYVRLGFSVAAHVEPQVLLVDEVLAVGDAQFRYRCTQRIEELRRNGVTIILISHNMPLVRGNCDRAILLHDGMILAEGEVVEIIRAYEALVQREQVASRERDGSSSLRHHFIAPIEISGVEIRNGDDARSSKFTHRDQVRIYVHYEAQEPLQDPTLLLRIIRSDGVTCAMIRTDDYGYSLDSLEGSGKICLSLEPLQLASGAYMIDARILGAVDGVALTNRHSGWFEVVGLSVGHGESGGVFYPSVRSARVLTKSQMQPARHEGEPTREG